MNFVPPKGFPQELFQEFGKYAGELLPAPLSDEALSDPLQAQHQFVQAWRAVRFRYRTCCEVNEEFKSLFATASELFREWNWDEEHGHKIQRCLYTFFTNGLSVFESFGFCLYFVGNAIKPKEFVHVQEPRNITLRSASDAFNAAFPNTAISNSLVDLRNDGEFRKLDSIRNILAHRICGIRAVRSYSVRELDGTFTGSREDVLHLHGADELQYDEELIQRHLDAITCTLSALVTAAVEFVRGAKKHRTRTP